MTTILAVHAHPDDECLLTGGALARYSAAGVRTVIVTCTDGAVGEVHADTNGRALADVRADELAAACKVLGVTRQVFLGYGDSGMQGTPENDAPGSFWQADIGEAAERLLAIWREERPDVVITYDERGGYEHPDHIRAHDVTLEAWRRAEGEPWAPRKLYLASIPRSAVREFARRLREAGLEPPGGGDAGNEGDGNDGDGNGDGIDFGVDDARFTTFVDVADFLTNKRDALRCHRTQVPEGSWFLAMPDEIARLAFGIETYILAEARVPTSVPESDLLAGL